MAYKGKCLHDTVHPITNELVKEGDPIEIADEAQFKSLVDIGAVEPIDAKKPAKSTPAAA